MKKLLLILIFLLFPTLTSATSLLKNEACAYEDGIHHESLYVYWPGKYPTVDEFVKKDEKLHYFIQVFPTAESLDRYRKAGNSPYTTYGFIRNSGSYLVSFDCARSKVSFSTKIRSTKWDQYGSFNWIDGEYLSYSFPRLLSRNSCKQWPDSLVIFPDFYEIFAEAEKTYPKSTKDICYARSVYKSLGGEKVQFDIEKHDNKTNESWYSRYHYEMNTGKLKKIR